MDLSVALPVLSHPIALHGATSPLRVDRTRDRTDRRSGLMTQLLAAHVCVCVCVVLYVGRGTLCYGG